MPNPMDPQDAGYYDPTLGVELQLTKQEWDIVWGAVMLLSHDARGSDRDVVRQLSARLEEYKDAQGAVIAL